LLTSAGYDVAAAEDGPEALLQLNNVVPDVIVSDLNMPRMSGFDLLSAVRRSFPGIVTVATSGAYRNSDELPAEVVADGFYSQGDDPHNLFGILAQQLRNVPARSAGRSTSRCRIFCRVRQFSFAKSGALAARRTTVVPSYLATELWPATSFHTPFCRTKVSVLSTVLTRCSPRTIPS
jgi:CheY-like chemotaxis protein